MSKQTRREFLERSLFAAAAASLAAVPTPTKAVEPSTKKKGPNERLRIACIGVGGRGGEHVREFGRNPHCEIVAIVDADEEHGKKRVENIKSWLGREPKFYVDLRKMLEDASIDAVSIATP